MSISLYTEPKYAPTLSISELSPTAFGFAVSSAFLTAFIPSYQSVQFLSLSLLLLIVLTAALQVLVARAEISSAGLSWRERTLERLSISQAAAWGLFGALTAYSAEPETIWTILFLSMAFIARAALLTPRESKDWLCALGLLALGPQLLVVATGLSSLPASQACLGLLFLALVLSAPLKQPPIPTLSADDDRPLEPIVVAEEPASAKTIGGGMASTSSVDLHIHQAERLETLGLLAGGVAHDFNNLLTAFIGHLDLIGLELDDPQAASKHLDAARESALDAAELCNQLLTYAGKQELEQVELDPNEVIEKMSQLMRVSLPKNVELVLDLQPNLPRILGDRSQMRQVILNLLTNATDATSAVPTGGQIVLRTSFDHGEKSASLRIQDNGCGMSQATADRIFEPFFSTKSKTGRGLGLASVYGIVQRHGGRIEVKSTIGAGTTFLLTFPSRTPFRKDPSAITEISVVLTRKTILLVEDEPMVREVCQKILMKSGHNVAVAEDGLQALEYMQRHGDEVSFILLDLTMPNLGGFETLKRLRITHPHIPVILTSGYSEDCVDLESLPDYQGFLKKPFSRRMLLNVIKPIFGIEPTA